MGYSWIWKVETNPGQYSWKEERYETITPSQQMVYINIRGIQLLVHRGFTSFIGINTTVFYSNAKELVNQPLKTIRLLDKTPDNARKRSGGKRCYAWYKNSTARHVGILTNHRIDDCLFPLEENRRRYNFPTVTAAQDWLSERCLEYLQRVKNCGDGDKDWSENYVDM